MEGQEQFESWGTDRLVEELDKKVEQNVPFEERKELQPIIAELRDRVDYFTGNKTRTELAAGAASSPH